MFFLKNNTASASEEKFFTISALVMLTSKIQKSYEMKNPAKIKFLDLEPRESKLNHLVRVICGLRKRLSTHAVRERNQFLTVKELHLNEILKLLLIALRNECPLKKIKSILTCVELEKVSKSRRSTSTSIKPSDNATGCSSKSIGVSERKLLNMFKYDPNFAKSIKQ